MIIRILKNASRHVSVFFTLFFWCLPFAWNASKYYTLLRVVGEVARPLLVIVASFFGKHVVDLLAGFWITPNTENMLFALLAGLFGIALSRSLINTIIQYGQAMHTDILNNKIIVSVMERSITADLEYFDNPSYHDKLMAVNRDSHAIAGLLWNALSCISAAVSFIGIFIVLSRVNLLYGLLMMAASIPSSVAAAKYTKSLYRLSITQINGHRQMGYCQNIASDRAYAQDIRLFKSGERLKQRYTRIWNELFSVKRSMSRKRAIITGVFDGLPEIVIVMIGVDIAFKVLNNNATVGDYVLYTGLVVQMLSAISMLSQSVMQIYDNRLKIENIKSMDQFNSRVLDTGTRALSKIDTIEFDNVRFTYPGSCKPALDGVSFILKKEQKVAFVGLNGSGKTTLIKLLLRMYDPESGVIRVNSIDSKEYTLSDLRLNFSVFFQEMRNYSFTLRENFSFVSEEQEYDDAAAEMALRNAYCDDIISMARKGLDTALTRFFDQEGIELSGGQHQKLALARTFFREHTALILDEPSSNLDPIAEQKVFESLESITSNKMTIFTSHRLSNVSLADRIIVLENGRVIEDGTQDELMKNNHRYAEMFKYQQERYMVESC